MFPCIPCYLGYDIIYLVVFYVSQFFFGVIYVQILNKSKASELFMYSLITFIRAFRSGHINAMFQSMIKRVHIFVDSIFIKHSSSRNPSARYHASACIRLNCEERRIRGYYLLYFLPLLHRIQIHHS